MENELYRKTIAPASESPDGESPEILYVTKEVNGFGVFMTGYEVFWGVLLKWYGPGERDEAIEFGVQEAERRLIEREERKARKAA